MSNKGIENDFPNLRSCGYSITSPETIDYNCIAWAAGDTDDWWWPVDYYWPPGVERKVTIQAFIKAYEMLGYAVCKSAENEEGFEKIALYVNSNGKPTHAARQKSNGYWTSKLGRSEDIEHITLDGLNGSTYGSVDTIMKRLR